MGVRTVLRYAPARSEMNQYKNKLIKHTILSTQSSDACYSVYLYSDTLLEFT